MPRSTLARMLIQSSPWRAAMPASRSSLTPSGCAASHDSPIAVISIGTRVPGTTRRVRDTLSRLCRIDARYTISSWSPTASPTLTLPASATLRISGKAMSGARLDWWKASARLSTTGASR
ncbi:hypothetical protein D3C72_1460990 [compost metagenome]